MNKSRIKIQILVGSVKIGEKSFVVTAGHANVLFKKFGWVILDGNAIDSSGSIFHFHLEGMLHVERLRLVLVGLAGLLSGDTDGYVLRFLARAQRVS